MNSDSRTLLISELAPDDVGAHLARDRRLIIPIGACDQYGPHLPLGSSTLLAESFARRLSEEFGVLRAPALPYGVNVPAERGYPGTASVREKSLHAMLNDLLASWEDCGITEFILLTVHDFDSHVEAVATVTGTSARVRVRVVEVLNMDLSEFLAGGAGPEHGGEAMTSLMLFLYPEKVRMDRALDHVPSDRAVSTLRRVPRIPADSPGSLGRPMVATAETGRRLFAHIYERIGSRVFAGNG
jgi:creatinine amidohydrolase